MLYVSFLVFIFLANVNKVSSPRDAKHCEWFCTNTAKTPLTAHKMEVRLNISKLIVQKCVYRNLENTTTTGYVFVSPLRDYQDGFSFMQFTTTTALEHTFQTEQLHKTATNVSCLLQPLSNQAEMNVSNGIDALNSLRFYISFDNRSWNKPFVGYVHLETNYHISAGFSNGNVLEDYELALTSFCHVLIRLIMIGYMIFFALVLTSFCNTRKKIESNNQSVREPEEGNDHTKSDSSSLLGTGREGQEHEDGPIQDQGGVYELRMTRSNEARRISVPFQLPIEEPPSGSSNDMKTVAASQTVAKIATVSKKGDNYVDLIDVSPVSIRSFFSDYVFLNKEISSKGEWNEVCYPMVRFVILNTFPISILLWVDVFVFWIPGLFFQGVTNLPSPYLTESVFTFAFKKHLGIFVCAFVFTLRMFCMCFEPPSKVCSIPDNIQQNFQSFGWETLKKNWEHASGKEAENCPFPLQLVSFIVETVKDCIISLPIVSLCHGGCWYTVHWFKNELAKALVLFLEFASVCMSIAWVAYISYCSFLSLEIAIESLLIGGMKYPIETLSAVAIYVLTRESIWKLYSLFTNIYVKLLDKLFKICWKHHCNEMKKYTIGKKTYLPKNLFDKACNEFEPVSKNFKKLVWYLFLYTICLFFLFSIIFGTKYPKKAVLPAAVTIIIVLRALIWELSFEESYKASDLRNLADAHSMT